jgi:hypothetical protein
MCRVSQEIGAAAGGRPYLGCNRIARAKAEMAMRWAVALRLKYRLYLRQKLQYLPVGTNEHARAGQVVVVAGDVGLDADGGGKGADSVVSEVVSH